MTQLKYLILLTILLIQSCCKESFPEYGISEKYEQPEYLNFSPEINLIEKRAFDFYTESRHSYHDSTRQEFLKYQAISCYDSIIRLDRYHMNAYIRKATILIEMRQYDQADSTLLLLTSLTDNPVGYYYLGITRERRGEDAKAKEYYRESIDAFNEFSKSIFFGFEEMTIRSMVLCKYYGPEKVLKETRKLLLKDRYNVELRIRRSTAKQYR